jgi:hypothetical protein
VISLHRHADQVRHVRSNPEIEEQRTLAQTHRLAD